MSQTMTKEIEVVSPEAVQQSALDFAHALAAMPQFQTFQAALASLREDEEALAAIQAFQHKQRSLQMMIQLNALSEADQAELNRLYQAFALRPTVQTYAQAEVDLKALCQAAGDALSWRIGQNFAAISGSSCCS